MKVDNNMRGNPDTTVILPLAFLLVVLWGTAYTFTGHAVPYIPPVWIVAARTSLAAILLLGYLKLRGHKLPPIRDASWRWYGFLSLFGLSAPFYMIATGQQTVPSGLAGILVGFMPMITIILAHFFIRDEQLTLKKVIGFLTGFFGLVILFLPDPLRFELIRNWQARLMILSAALFYAIATIIAKRAPDVPASVGTTMMLVSAAITMVVIASLTGWPETRPPNSALLAVAALAVGSTGIANIIYLYLIKQIGPSAVSKINYLVPVFSVLAGMAFLHEPFKWRYILALAIIMTGLMIARGGKTGPRF